VREARRVYVSGRVQGVNFRAATARAARDLGVEGYARNLDDGRVEVLLVGEREALAGLLGWLAHGPPFAEVAGLEEAPASAGELAGRRGFLRL
jgi:acylphosphatase